MISFHDDLLSSRQARTPFIPFLLFLISLILRFCLLQGEHAQGRDVIPAQPFSAIVARDPATLLQLRQDTI